jgi:integrase
MAGVREADRTAGLDNPFADPRVRDVWLGIRRERGLAQRGCDPLEIVELRRIVARLPASKIGKRDRALLVLGFAGGFRRSELVALDVDDVRTVPHGLEITIRKSKTDQEGRGRLLGLPYGSYLMTCPVRSLQAWLDAAKITEGPIFRGVDRHGNVAANRLGAQVVARVVKRTARAVGINAQFLAEHSLRSGFMTAAEDAGASGSAIMAQTGYRSAATMQRYLKRKSIWKANAAALVLVGL